MVNEIISRQALRAAMYHEAFEIDSDMQKWDNGCWIRYKMFEKVLESAPAIETINGYNIRFLQQIAAIALSQNIEPAEAIGIMRNADRLISLFIKEQNIRIDDYLKSIINQGGGYDQNRRI